MDAIKNFEELKSHLKSAGKRKRLALANALDSHSLEAVMMSVEEGFIDAYLVGKKEEVARLLEQEFGEKVKKYGDYLHIVDCRGDAAEATTQATLIGGGCDGACRRDSVPAPYG